MPIYGYRCGTCGHEFELLQNLSDQPPSTCPKCGAKTLKKKHYAAGVIFKGSGFYTTDYKASSASGEASSNGSKGSESGSDSKTETKSESKSESKSETKTEKSSAKTSEAAS